MGIGIAITLCAAVGLAAAIAELHGRQPTTTEMSRGYRAGLAFLVGMIALVVLSPQIALVFDRPLPVEPPVNPLAGEGCHDDSSDDALIFVIILAMYFGARFGLGTLAAAVRGIAAPPARVVTGKRALMIAAFFLAAIFPLVTARILVPGPAPDDFTTYGALTPDSGARGWRVERTISALHDGSLVDLPVLSAPVSDIKRGGGGHGSFATGPYLRAGIHGWVAGAPVLIFKNEPSTELVGAPVAERSPQDVPPERRPRFESWPQVAPRADGEGWILVERRRDGSTFAMKVSSWGDADDVQPRDIWLVIRPSELPHGVAFALFLVGLGLARAAHRRGNSPGLALLAAWLWLEAGALDLFYYAPFLGL